MTDTNPLDGLEDVLKRMKPSDRVRIIIQLKRPADYHARMDAAQDDAHRYGIMKNATGDAARPVHDYLNQNGITYRPARRLPFVSAYLNAQEIRDTAKIPTVEQLVDDGPI